MLNAENIPRHKCKEKNKNNHFLFWYIMKNNFCEYFYTLFYAYVC